MAETQAKHRHSAGRLSLPEAKATVEAAAEGKSKAKPAGAGASAKRPGAKRSTRKPAPAKRARRKRRSILQLIRESWFYRIYFALLALCAVGLVVGLVTLYGVMGEYEATRPVHCAEAVLAQIESRDWAALRELDESAKKMKFEGEQAYAQYMEGITSGGTFTLKNLIAIDENEQKYSVLMDGKKFAEMTLEHSGELTKHNFDGWKLKTLETTAMASDAYTYTVPSDSTVEVNGQALGEADILEAGISTAAEGNLPEGVAAPTLTKYGVYMFTGAPQSVRVVDRNGNEQALAQDGERDWSCGLPSDDEQIKAQCEDSVIKWGRRLAAYTTGDYNKFDLSNACVNPSPARTYIRNMQNQWAATHSGYDFKNIETGSYYIYADNCFSCEISFDYIVHYVKGDKSYPTKYTLYFVRNGGTFKLYSFTMN